LSIPNRYESVTRPMTVTVRAQDRKGNSFTITAEGFKARALCHEIDHLDGILYIDKTDKKVCRRGE
ncbi:MAG: peptide deformylase, partial [Acutalibacteraceae bacterium]|nr:peptide deformylase [Acutalibacteraceae bacterium]